MLILITAKSSSPPRKKSGGFTLLELMVVVAIVAILIVVVLPGFKEFFIKNRLTAQTNDFVTAISLARNEAIKRGRPVCLVRTNTNWEMGYRIFVDKSKLTNLSADTDACKTDSATGCALGDASCEIFVQNQELTGGNTLRTGSGTSSGSYGLWLRFNSMGVVVDRKNAGINGDYRLCRSDKIISKSNLIKISVTGFPISTVGTTQCP
ncbi:putative Tfp pilus assembly protein FimT [Candidatus Competibacter denitrificans Run_A_D11]|uniref:Type II secretion system protein H n=1 Tax=Candidatus Competibacter denitrificans Run_A_D11 TaxID=1400863 RepID=W6M8E3_9GAMM|nr:GspH/FimT family pseudopilin [Candidatus Competibacter denitrificans]CDI03867.1 putative Tfp pilus assembly protein FimT [Candidatus Competibacter denitrificans Run_A_D11]HRC69393.1 GspH/FimT family pseudopilin [Candidatus Competibacter denitrificans]